MIITPLNFDQRVALIGLALIIAFLLIDGYYHCKEPNPMTDNPFDPAEARLGTVRADRRVLAALTDDAGTIRDVESALVVLGAAFPHLDVQAHEIRHIEHGEWAVPVPVEVWVIVDHLEKEFAVSFTDEPTDWTVSLQIDANPIRSEAV